MASDTMEHPFCRNGRGCNSWKSCSHLDCNGTQENANSHKLFYRFVRRIDSCHLTQLSRLSSTVNLSIADAMVSTLNTTLNFVYMLNSNWPFGTLFCKISQFVASLSICASVFTLMAIAIDR